MADYPSDRRTLGSTSITVSTVAMGCWPIAGITSTDVTKQDSRETLAACLDSGINFLDTAYCYGFDGISELLVGEAVRGRRDEVVLATKGGIHWDSEKVRRLDGRPDTLKRECMESLRRLGSDYVDLLYLHAPDPEVPIGESACALADLHAAGYARCIGLSNASLDQIKQFHAVCPLSAIQPAYNMLQRGIEAEIVPWCRKHQVAVFVYWPLMKGLLAGRLHRDHLFAANDGRAKYPMFQGEEWQKNQDFVDQLREVATANDKTVAQVVVNWTIHRDGITGALCGAKRPYQIQETAGAMGWKLSNADVAKIAAAIERRGEPKTGQAV